MRNDYKKSVNYKVRHNRQNGGFTLIEIMLSLTILAVVSSIATVSYNGYIDATNNSIAVHHLTSLAIIINSYEANNGTYPDSLSDIGNDNLLDPWGSPYEYLKIANGGGLGGVRKDRNLVPLNSNFDLYSKGKDGESRSPLTAPVSQDDIIYANDGGYVGIGSDY